MEVKNKNKKSFVFGAKSAPKKTKWSNSSFWLDFESDEDRAGKVDVVTLAGYKRAISNFVNIVTGKTDIHVKYNDNDMSYTDGKTVTISSKLKDGKSFDTTVGLALHEGSHCLLTDFKALHKWGSLCNDYRKMVLVKDIINVIEDRRIDSYIYKNAPGYRGYYDALYEEYFYSPSINNAIKHKLKSKPEIDNYMFHIINIANPNRDENALPGLKSIYDLIDLKNIDRLKSTTASIELAGEVYELLSKLVEEHKQNDLPDNDQDAESNMLTSGEGIESDEDSDNDSDEESNETLTPKERRAKEKAEKEAAKQEQKEFKDIQKNLDNDIKKQKDFINGNIKKGKIQKTQAKQVEAMTSNDVYVENVGKVMHENGTIYRNSSVNALVVNGITSTILESGLVSGHYNTYYNEKDSTQAVTEGMQLGILLGKKLKTRDEERVLKTTRCANGSIDKRLIAELGFGAENVFSQIVHYTVKPVYVHLTIDASGSMSGNNWNKSLKTAVAIAKACSMVSNIHVCIDIRGEAHSMYGTPLTWVVYDSKKNNMNHILKHFPMLRATSSTPESLCYEAIRKQVIKNANGKDAYLITFSDGEPNFHGNNYQYTGEAAYIHCRNQVNAFKQSNIHVLAYFVSDYRADSYYNKVFKGMYGANSAYIDTTQLNTLSRSINSMFERKQIA